ncbi:MAG: hypothetical protein AAFX78_03425 [Cyanobacteria bacterium J06638_20]
MNNWSVVAIITVLMVGIVAIAKMPNQCIVVQPSAAHEQPTR